jgi:hypothetical protein
MQRARQLQLDRFVDNTECTRPVWAGSDGARRNQAALRKFRAGEGIFAGISNS